MYNIYNSFEVSCRDTSESKGSAPTEPFSFVLYLILAIEKAYSLTEKVSEYASFTNVINKILASNFVSYLLVLFPICFTR